jgi:hypothetical protein
VIRFTASGFLLDSRAMAARIATAGLGLALFASGCDTIGSDISAFTESFSPPTPAEAAAWAVDTNDAENQRRGIALLASAPWGGAEPYVNLYRLYIDENTDPLVKAFAIRALGRHGDAPDAPLVAKQLASTYRIVRYEAAKALQRLHDPAVANDIWLRLVDQNEEADVRTELAIALGQYPSDAVFQALVNALDHRELAVNWAALDSLQTLTGNDFGLNQAAWLRWKDSTQVAFLDEERFLYPTFRRHKWWLDYVLFWVPIEFEDPSMPIGTKGAGPRRTYEGDVQPPPEFQLPEAEPKDGADAAEQPRAR